MIRSPNVRVTVDLNQIRENARQIARATNVAVLAVIKADAYGLGAERVATALANVVDEFCVFGPDEAERIDLWRRTGKPAIAIGPPAHLDPQMYRALHVRPAVSTIEQARSLQSAGPVVCIDTGQQRFACPPEHVGEVMAAGGSGEVFTHATSMRQVNLLREAAGRKASRLHAAGSSLLNDPDAWLDAVRPGLAIYRGAARVRTKLVESRRSTGPAGYTGFVVPWHGVIPAGYSNGLRVGPCLVNGRPSRILEVGMQTAFVETEPADQAGSDVVLLGEGLSESHVASAWNTSPQECLVCLAGAGPREYEE